MLGFEHVSTAGSYNNLGALYQDMGNYQKADEFYMKGLKIQEKVMNLIIFK